VEGMSKKVGKDYLSD